MSKTPQATITVGEAEITRDVCSLTLRTRAEDGNTLSIVGGIDVCVDDEFARSAIVEYYDEQKHNDTTGGGSDD